MGIKSAKGSEYPITDHPEMPTESTQRMYAINEKRGDTNNLAVL